MKAYKLSCRDNDHGAHVVFAKTARGARRQHHTDICDCEFVDRYVHRAKDFDDLAPGPITIAQYLDRDWNWDCHGCGKACWKQHAPLIIGDDVFCNLDCVKLARDRWPVDVSKYHESVRELCDGIDAWLASLPAPVAPVGQGHTEGVWQ